MASALEKCAAARFLYLLNLAYEKLVHSDCLQLISYLPGNPGCLHQFARAKARSRFSVQAASIVSVKRSAEDEIPMS
jgi:hypothetical protein